MSGGPSSKPEYPPLLLPGFHSATLASLEAMCVDPFPTSSTRSEIYDGLKAVVASLSDVNVVGELWVDGSFLTKKIDPADVDLVLRLEPSFVDEASDSQLAIIDWFGDDLAPQHHCDSYVFVEYPKGHDLEGEGEWNRAYWIKQFGFSRGGDYKGILVLSIE